MITQREKQHSQHIIRLPNMVQWNVTKLQSPYKASVVLHKQEHLYTKILCWGGEANLDYYQNIYLFHSIFISP